MFYSIVPVSIHRVWVFDDAVAGLGLQVDAALNDANLKAVWCVIMSAIVYLQPD